MSNLGLRSGNPTKFIRIGDLFCKCVVYSKQLRINPTIDHTVRFDVVTKQIFLLVT